MNPRRRRNLRPTTSEVPVEFPDMTDSASDILEDAKITIAQLQKYVGKGSGKGGRITKSDAQKIVTALKQATEEEE